MPKKYRLPKRRGHKGLKIFAILMTIFVVFPIAFVFAAFYDNTTKQVSNSEVHYQNIVSESLYKGIEKLGNEGKLGFKIDENMIDGIMVSACDMINQKQFVPKMYCYINDNNYIFAVDLQASFFKTRVLLNTTLAKDDSNDTLIFQINNITIGRLPIPFNWITGIASNFITDDAINNIFAGTGFHFKCELAKSRLTYNRETFKEDVGKYVSVLGSNNPFLNVMLSMFGNNEVLETSYKNGVSATFDLTKLTLSESPYKEPAPIDFDSTMLASHKAKIVEWMNAKDSNNEPVLKEADVAKTFNYLIRGYDDGNKEFINSIANEPLGTKIKDYLGTFEVTSLEDYRGSKIGFPNKASNLTFQDYCGDMDCTVDITGPTTPTSVSLEIAAQNYDDDNDCYKGLNPFMAQEMTTAIGQTIPVTYLDGSNWKFEYILIDGMYIGFKKDETAEKNHEMVIYLRFNISGKYSITMTVSTDEIRIEGTTSSSLGKLKFKLESINFGAIRFEDEETIQTLLSLLPSGSEPFIFEDGNFCVNLDKLVGESVISEIAPFIAEHKDSLSKEIENNALKLTFSI